MAYTPVLLDDFNDGVLDEAVRWNITQGPGASESGGTLNTPCTMDYPRVEGRVFQDLSKGIWAAKLTATGTRGDATEFYLGAHDGAGNHISAMGAPSGAYITFQPGGTATFNTEVITDVSVGVGGSWVNGTWWGIGNLGSDNVLRMYKSVDGLTWTEMARCNVGGTYNKAHTSILFMGGIWDGTVSSLVAKFDDATFFAVDSGSESYRPVKIRSGAGWVYATPKARIGGVWSSVNPKTRVGGNWISTS